MSEAINTLKGASLKAKLKELSLTSSGSKAKMIEKLLEYIKSHLDEKTQDQWIKFVTSETTPDKESKQRVLTRLLNEHTLVVVKEKNKELGLKYYGNKGDLIQIFVDCIRGKFMLQFITHESLRFVT